MNSDVCLQGSTVLQQGRPEGVQRLTGMVMLTVQSAKYFCYFPHSTVWATIVVILVVVSWFIVRVSEEQSC